MVQGEELQSKILFPSRKTCGDAMDSIYEPVLAHWPNSMAQCDPTDIISKTIRPKARPTK